MTTYVFRCGAKEQVRCMVARYTGRFSVPQEGIEFNDRCKPYFKDNPEKDCPTTLSASEDVKALILKAGYELLRDLPDSV